MTLPEKIRRFTPVEYYRLEREAEYKSNYYDGEIFAIAGGTARHSLICSNIGRETGNRLKKTPCAVYESNLRLKIAATGLRTYPDISVYCEPLSHDEEDPAGETYTNPSVIFEVLSPSTEAYDRGFKAENYRRVQSLRAYILIAQDAPHAEVFERQPEGTWLLREATGTGASVRIPGLDIDLPLAEVYARVDFSEPQLAAEKPSARGVTPQ